MRERLEDDPYPPQEKILGDALREYIDRLNAGEGLDKEEIRRSHPAIAERLIEEIEWYELLGGPLDPEDLLGTLGDFTLRRRLGQGGMGVVYEAWENSMDRRVALKVLPAGIAADDRAFQRFLREARAAGKLNHPSVVPVYATGIKERTPYFAMEFVDGETLAQILGKMRTEGPGAPTPFGASSEDQEFYLRVARAFAEVADGLQHAHSMGVIHRDIKPSNLILDRGGCRRAGAADTRAGAADTRAGAADARAGAADARASAADTGPRAGDLRAGAADTEWGFRGRLRILDFGLARLEGQESLTISGEFVGTPLYMSPEQALRRKVEIDHRTDVYSLGATLYEAITLRPPFQGKDHQDTLSQIIERDPAEPSNLNRRVPRDLETIVLKCLRKDPADRYGTAEALSQDLRRFVRGDPIEARPQARWERFARRMRRHRWRILAAAAFAVLVLSLALVAHRGQQARRAVVLVRYEPAVLAVLRKIHAGQFSLRVAAGEAGGLLRFWGWQTLPVSPEDIRRLVKEGGSEDLEEVVKELEQAAQATCTWPRARKRETPSPQ